MPDKPKIAVVTGGGRNIGRAIALGFASRGHRVVVADLDAVNAHNVAREIESTGGEAVGIALDIGDTAAIEVLVEETRRRFGDADILVNNASRFNDLQRVPFQEIAMDEWRSVMDINITGTFSCIKAFETGMRRRKWGRIVNVSSGTVRMGRPDFLHYVTSKAALIGMSRSLARELGPHGITVNTLLPGVVFTADQRRTLKPDYQEMILRAQCVPEAVAPESMAGPVLFLCSDDARHVTGQELAVDAGLTHG